MTRTNESIHLREQTQNAFSAASDSLHLGLDLDGLLDEATGFFTALTSIWPGRVVIISYRNDYAKAEADLARLNITYDELILVDSFDAKADVIVEKKIRVYFDDQPEMIKNIAEGVHVMLYRNGGNFDFEDRLWMFSDRTAKLL